MRTLPIRLERAEWIAFAAVLLLALVALFPLALALRMLGSDAISARAARGSVWGGRLEDAAVGPFRLGTVATRLQLAPLLTGRARVDLAGRAGSGGISTSPARSGADDVTAILEPAEPVAGLPIDRVAFEDFSFAFSRERCVRGEGRVRITFAGPVGGLSLGQGLGGVARCEGAELVLPLVGQSGMEALTLRVTGDGRYRGRLTVRAVDSALAQGLAAAGFRPAGEGVARAFAGRL